MANRKLPFGYCFVGIAIIALPSGIITAGYMEELNRAAASEQEEEKD